MNLLPAFFEDHTADRCTVRPLSPWNKLIASTRFDLRSLWQNHHDTAYRLLIATLTLLIVASTSSTASAELGGEKRFFSLQAARNGGSTPMQMSLKQGNFLGLGNYQARTPRQSLKLTADRTINRTVELASLPIVRDSSEQEFKMPKQQDSDIQKMPSLQKGQLRHQWPISEDVTEKVTSGYGFRKDPFHGKRAFHAGIDIAAPLGTKVLATADGIVDSTGYGKGLGKYVKIKHSDGSYSIYGHLGNSTVSAGKAVIAGETIGRIGMTGRTTGPHLHFGIKQGEALINPVARLYIPKAIRSRYAGLLFKDSAEKSEKSLEKVALSR
ncbi:MAG: M23 family metallopeptidase [Rickettsiales bacterium]